MNNLMKTINEIKNNNFGITIRKVVINDTNVYLFFITQIVNRVVINESIIKPILNIKNKSVLNINYLIDKIICVDDIFIAADANKFMEYILNGNTIIAMENEENYIVLNTKKIEKRPVNSPDVESVVKGPKDCFSENFDTNLSLIRYRIKDINLRIDKYSLGTRTKTSVGIIYLSDVANETTVNDIKQKISNIKIDGILESGYIQKLLTKTPFNFFPKTGIAERSDSACSAILNGKICIIVEGSNLAIVLPKTLIEFGDSGEDHYQNLYAGFLAKLIRFLSIFLTLTISSLYVMLTGFHIDIIPVKYALILAQGRSKVPFPSFIEATLSEILSEILREASVRLPKQIGPAIGIVGTIVIGQASVTAGLISPLMVIIIALSTMCSFAAPDITIMNSVRILKFGLLFITSILGVLGFSIGSILIITALCSVESFGFSYMNPIIPFHFKDIKNFIFSDVNLGDTRPEYLHNKDNKRK